MSSFQAKILNREALLGFIEGLEGFEKDKAINNGLRKGGQILARQGKKRLKQSMHNPAGVTGNLLKSFKVKTKRQKLGVLVGFKNRLGNHAHLLDRGTKARKTKKGYNRGKIPSPYNGFKLYFWSDTKDAEMKSAVEEVYKGITTAVERIKERHS